MINPVVTQNNTGKSEFTATLLSLRFPRNVEIEFEEDYFYKSLSQLRLSIVLALILYAVFGVLDYLMIPRVEGKVWLIRYGIVCPYLIAYLLFSRSRIFRRVYQPSIFFSTLVIGFGIIAMTVIAYPPGSYYYYAGLILVLMWAYTSTAARFIYATSAGWTLVMVYEIVAYGYSHTPLPILISNTFFFLSANIIGMLACYLIELYKRRDFLQRKVIEDERFKSETLLEEIHDELTLASEIQKGLLPPPTFTWDGGELVSCSRPTLEIGGDFYRYRLDENGRFILAVGDVSGHGIPAALLMAATLTLFDTSFTQNICPGDRLSHLDEELLPYAEPRHQNCAFCYMELEKHVMRICNAGGIPPYIRRHNGPVEVVNAKGFPLGHGFGLLYGYAEMELRISAGDLVILMSDGVVEAKDIHNQMFGFNRLKNTIADSPAHTAQAMLEYLVNEVTSFTDIRQVQDDFTIVVVQVN